MLCPVFYGGEQGTRLTSFAREFAPQTILLYTSFDKTSSCKRLLGFESHFTLKQKAGHSFCYALFFLAESKGFEPSNRFRRLHDFQSCSFDQLGQLSIDQMTRNIIYDFIQKSKQIFRIIQNLLYRRISI